MGAREYCIYGSFVLFQFYIYLYLFWCFISCFRTNQKILIKLHMFPLIFADIRSVHRVHQLVCM